VNIVNIVHIVNVMDIVNTVNMVLEPGHPAREPGALGTDIGIC